MISVLHNKAELWKPVPCWLVCCVLVCMRLKVVCWRDTAARPSVELKMELLEQVCSAIDSVGRVQAEGWKQSVTWLHAE